MATAKKSKEANSAEAALRALDNLYCADKENRPPSAEAVKLFAEAYREWLRLEGKKSLDDILGLSTKRGRDPVGKTHAIGVRDYVYCDFMMKLIALGFTLDEAAHAVAEKEKLWFSLLTRWNIKPLSEKSTKALFTREGGKALALEVDAPNRQLKLVRAIGDKSALKTVPLTGQERATFLEQFPKYVIPDRFKK